MIITSCVVLLWTAAEIAVVKEMCERGCSNAEIVAQLPGRTLDATKHQVQQLRTNGLQRVYK